MCCPFSISRYHFKVLPSTYQHSLYISGFYNPLFFLVFHLSVIVLYCFLSPYPVTCPAHLSPRAHSSTSSFLLPPGYLSHTYILIQGPYNSGFLFFFQNTLQTLYHIIPVPSLQTTSLTFLLQVFKSLLAVSALTSCWTQWLAFCLFPSLCVHAVSLAGMPYLPTLPCQVKSS